jgi:cell wall-associated protease
MRINPFFAGAALLVLVLPTAQALDSGQRREKTADQAWHFLDPEEDTVAGIGLNRAYAFLAGRKTQKVVVAIIDSGFDTEHEDLKGVLWINPGEIAGNGLDDDGNGYIDDVHGWNFNGGPGGNVTYDNLELTREYVRLSKKFESNPNPKDREYTYWLEIQEEFTDMRGHYLSLQKRYGQIRQMLQRSFAALGNYLPGDSISVARLELVSSEDDRILSLRDSALQLLGKYEAMRKTGTSTLADAYPAADVLSWMARSEDMIRMYTDYLLNPDFDPRHVVGDDYANPKEKYYGNNEVGDFSGTQGYHGTHVAGIAGAERENGVGVDGVAGHISLMLLRAVSSGDERDKDVANAIRYATDNGARVVNMSFGKFYSPYKKVVYKAIRHAENKGVLLVHGSGNESTFTDERPTYPNPWYKRKREAGNWLNVGASSAALDEDLPADFSNYGPKSVHLFAPGVQVYSTMPGNTYKPANGTSMASPVVAGVAALLMSHYPALSAGEVREILLQSAFRPENLQVKQPGTGELVDFNSLSRTGGIVNAYRAVQLAEHHNK